MVRLRKSKNKLKIILCCILGFIVAVGGIVGILVLVPLMEGEKEPPVVDSAVNEKNDPGDMTYEQHAASGDDGYRTLTYLAYVLSEQPYYHSESVTVSVAPFNMTQYTKSFKDYSDGIMISSDLTYGIKNAGTQAAFVPGGNEEGRGAGVYMRTSSGSVNADSTGTSVSWNDDVVYYDRESYLYAYGEYSTEMTVYLLTEETITSWDPATDNGDGTYTQTFYLDAEKACYYYQYAMKTRGGLLTLPVFESISMEVTFDNNYRVLQIDVVENSRINPFTWMDSTSTTTTSYTYGEENFDRPHYDYYADYFEQYVGNLGSEDGDDDELTPLDLLMNAFAGVLNGEGQQFDAVVMAGGKTYYGRVYLSLDINGISSGDILGSIDARIALSEDENIDEQDLYISFADGDIRAYYSSDFALSADVNEFSDIVSQFESWVQGLSGDGTAAADEGGSADEGGFSLDELLQQFTNGTTEEYDGGLTYTASLEISGISLDAVFDFSKQDGGDAATYSLNSAQIGGIAYNGSPVELSLALEPSEGEIISHEESETPFDLSVAAQNLYELLNSDAIGVEISLGGEKLADFLSSLGIADLGASLDDLSLQISGAVDINGITVAASFTLSDINAGRTVLAADVYYVYNDGSGEYGTAYLNISNILGAETSAKVYCDIAELAATIKTLIDRLSSGDVAEGVSEGSEGVVSAADGSDIVSLINGILGLDLGAVVKEVNAGAAVIGATVDLDSVFALLGADVSLGDITLEYHLGDFDREDYNNAGGWLYGSIPSLGAEAYIYGSDAAIDGIEKDDYLDLDELIGSVGGIINSAVVEINLEISGEALADVLASNGIVDLGDSADGLVLEIEGSVSASELEARLALSLHDENKIYFAADAYYVYGGEGYGTAYIDLTHILGARYDGIKVYCDIAELASAVGWLVDDAAGQTEGAGTEESAGIAGIITGILTIDLGEIVKELSANADGITTTVDIGGILEYFTETDIKLGDVTLEYTFGEGGGRLSGTALGGGLTMSVTGSDAEISAPDTEEYYDLTALVNSIYEIFESNTVRVLLDITGEALSEILAENGITGADELLAGANIHVSGNIDIDTLAVKGTLSFSGADRTYFAADVFYSYDEDGYGDIYLSITELLGSECNIKVYGNIGDIISSVEELIGTVAGGDTAGGAASGAEVSQVADIVSQILSVNLGSIVRWLRIDEYGVVATVDVDHLLGSLAGIDLGVGDMFMLYDGHFLEGTAMDGGLELLLYGSEMYAYGPNADAYLNINDLIKSVQELLSSSVLGVNITLRGAELADVLAANGLVDLGDSIDGLALTLNGGADINDLTAAASASLVGADGYTYLNADIYYEYGAAESGGGYGTVYLTVNQLFGRDCSIKLFCDISEAAEAVRELFGTENISSGPDAASPEESDMVAAIIGNVLEMDFAGLVTELTANAEGLGAAVNLDNVLNLILGGEHNYDLGTANLHYDIQNDMLTGSALGGGVEISISRGEAFAAPVKEGYIDFNDLLALVAGVKDEVQSIIDGHSVRFEITDTRFTADGVTFGVSGEGEAVWDDAALVSLALDFTVATGGKDGTSENTVKLIYNAGAADDEPLVQLAINEVGLIITQNDMDRFGEDLNGLIAAINNLLGGTAGSSTGNADDSQLVSVLTGGDSTGSDVAGILQLILGIFNDGYEEGTVGNALAELLDGLYSALLKGGMDIEDGQLTVSVGGLNVTFGADPDDGLYLSGSVENIAVFNAGVSAGTGSYAPEFADGTVFYSSAADGNSGGSFTRAIYNFIFGTYESVDIGSFLGGDAYSVNIKLTGDNSDIEALKGVAVNADLYFAANKAEGAVADQKIAGADIAVTADSFTFAADFIFSGDMLYITLTEINGAELNIVLKASADNIYRAVENLIKVVQNDKIVSLVSGLFGGQAAAASTFEDIATYGGPAAGPESDNIADLISAILNFKYSEIIGISSDEDSFVATLNIDELLDALNVNAGTPIGTATLRLAGGENRGIYIGIDDWLTVNAQPDKDVVITVPEDSDDIIDIGFVADLIDDVNKFVSSNKEGNGTVYTFYTQSMAMEYSVIKINIKDLYVSIGILDGELYVSAEGEISISIDLFDLGEDWDIDIAGVDFGLTLYNDYLTFARDVGGARPYYWVMTPDYFLENLFAKQDDGAGTDSPLRWLFSISSGTWDLVANNVNLDIGSDEDAPVTVDIGGGTADTAADSSENADQNSGGIAVTNYVNYFISKIVLNGVNREYSFGIQDNLLENLGLSNANDFYAFSVADDVIGSLTGGALTMLDVGITRDQSNGIGSVIADTSLGGQLTVNLSMQYQPERDMVENYFNAASEAAKSYSGDSAYDFNNEIGYEDYSDYYRGTYVAGVKIEPLNGAEDFNYMYAEDIVNDYYSVIVLDSDGNEIYNGKLKHGDRINFYSNGIYPSPDANGNIVVYLWNNGGVNEAYASYTIDGGHTAGNKPEGNTLVFTAATVEYSVEENGVAYTFVGSNEHSYAAHYAITGTTGDIGKYYNGATLVLENEINGFPVVEIASGAFDNSTGTGRNKGNSNLANNPDGSLKNVVVPENIKWVGGRAFLDNKGIQSIVFLAPSVEFSNDMTFYNMHGTNGGNSSADKQNFPFYGCGTDDSNTNLKIYYNSTISTSNYIFCFSRTTDWIGRETLHYVNSAGGEVHSAGTWTYIEYALSEDSVINEAGLSEDVIFSGLQFVTTDSVSADMIAEIVLENIDAFTAENCGYINGYYVDVIVEQVNNRATVTVSLAEGQEQERYYAADSLEISSTVEGADTELDLFEITYAEFKPYGADGRIFVKADSDVIFTLKQEFADYYSLSKVGDNEADGDSYVFDSMTDAVNFGKITLDFEAIGNYVTVYSDISFAYGGAQYAGDSSANQMLVGASVTELGIPSTTNSGYYFLGWAVENNGTLEFTTATIENGVTYYAVWVNSSVALNLTAVENGNIVTSEFIASAKSGSEGSAPLLYGDSSYTTSFSNISKSCTTVFARWKFTVNIGTQDNAKVTIDNNSYYEGDEVNYEIKFTEDYDRTFNVTPSDSNITIDGDISGDSAGLYSFTMPSCNVTISASSSNCVAAGTLITLADGSQKKVEDLTGDELLLVWNLETGTFDAAPIVFIDSDAECEYEIINLIFSDGTEVKVISEHAFWDYDLNEYVYLDRYAGKYIGHWFNKQTTDDDGNFANTAVQLTDVVITYEVTSAYSPVTYSHLCYYVNGMLSMPGGISGLFNIFEVDPDTMMYDREAMEADIAEYGLFTYEDFEGLISEEVFEAFNGKYLKVAIGKGILTWDDIFYLVERYSQFF